MYSEYLGTGYHDKIRNLLTVNTELLPDRIINADVNIGAMKKIIAPAVDRKNLLHGGIQTEEQFNKLSEAACYVLCGVLCVALKSRTSTPPYNLPKYKKNWDKKRNKFVQKGNLLIKELMTS